MSLRSRNKINATFNMSSLADIIFLLLIFFLITSRMVTPNVLPVKRPSSNITQAVDPVARITVNDQLQYFVDGKSASFGELSSLISPKLAEKERPVVILDMDKSISIERLVEMYDLANQLRFELVLATDPKSKK